MSKQPNSRERGATFSQTLSVKLNSVSQAIGMRADYLIYAAIALYTLVFSYFTILRHQAFMTRFDLGVYDRALWNALKFGDFGGQFSHRPILFLILPIYALYPTPGTLLTLQSFILALGSLPLYKLARDEFRNRLFALAFSLVYLLNVPLHGINYFDFHVEAFIPAIFISLFYLYKKGRWVMGIIFTLLALSCIEFMPLITFFFGLFIAIRTTLNGVKSKRLRGTAGTVPFVFALVVMVLSVCWFALVSRGIGALEERTGGPAGFWIWWGFGFEDILTNVATHPGDAILTMFQSRKMEYLLYLFSPLLFLSLLAPLELLPAIPWFVAALLSNSVEPTSIEYQYSGFVLGVVFIAAVYGAKRLSLFREGGKVNTSILGKSLVLMIAVNLILVASLSPVSPIYDRGDRPSVGSHELAMHEVLSLIPLEGSVLVQENIFPHLSHRPRVYFTYFDHLLEPMVGLDADYVIADVKSRYFLPMEDVIPTLLTENRYGLYASADGVLLYKRWYKGKPILYQPFTEIFDYRDLEIHSGAVVFDDTSRSGRSLIHTTRDAPDVVFWYGPFEFLPPGDFAATFRLKIVPQSPLSPMERLLTLDVTTGAGEILLAHRDVHPYLEDLTPPFEVSPNSVGAYDYCMVYFRSRDKTQRTIRITVEGAGILDVFDPELNRSLLDPVLVENETISVQWDGEGVFEPRIGKGSTVTRLVLDWEFDPKDREYVWQNFTIYFFMDRPRMIELRGTQVSNSTDIYLDYIEVKQLHH